MTVNISFQSFVLASFTLSFKRIVEFLSWLYLCFDTCVSCFVLPSSVVQFSRTVFCLRFRGDSISIAHCQSFVKYFFRVFSLFSCLSSPDLLYPLLFRESVPIISLLLTLVNTFLTGFLKKLNYYFKGTNDIYGTIIISTILPFIHSIYNFFGGYFVNHIYTNSYHLYYTYRNYAAYGQKAGGSA